MKKGISIIVLVITIIVMLIIVGTIAIYTNSGNIMGTATETKFKENLETYRSQVAAYITHEYAKGNFDPESINVYEAEEMKNIIEDISVEEAKDLNILNGKLTYVGTELNKIKWAKDINISLDVPYIKSGLVVWFDAIYNGGFGVHNNNTSASKAIWKDLSGNGNDGTLNGFKYNEGSGWYDTYLNCNNYNSEWGDFIKVQNYQTTTTDYTIEILLNYNDYKDKTYHGISYLGTRGQLFRRKHLYR